MLRLVNHDFQSVRGPKGRVYVQGVVLVGVDQSRGLLSPQPFFNDL